MLSESTAVRPPVSRVMSIRQRSRSGDSTVYQSQTDVAVAVASGSAGAANSSAMMMVRSSSDSNILLDTDKHKGPQGCADTHYS